MNLRTFCRLAVLRLGKLFSARDELGHRLSQRLPWSRRQSGKERLNRVAEGLPAQFLCRFAILQDA